MTKTHASDCALHNAPAYAPGPCSCGVSFRFRKWAYDASRDASGWKRHSRETIVADVVAGALARAYGQQRVVRASTLIGRAMHGELTPNETVVIEAAWAQEWRETDAALLADRGLDSDVISEDGSWLSPEKRAELAMPPSLAEIRAALAPWLEYWATQPEPPLANNVLAFAA